MGFAYRDLMEEVDVNDPGALPPANNLNPDHFRTRNQLYGGDVGVRFGGVGCSRLFSGPGSCSAVGSNHETAVLAGETISPAGVITPGRLCW